MISEHRFEIGDTVTTPEGATATVVAIGPDGMFDLLLISGKGAGRLAWRSAKGGRLTKLQSTGN